MTAVTYTIYSLITVIIVSFLDFGCFGTIAGKVYFVVAILGAMLRKDEYGIASYVRAVNLKGQHYEALDYFFHTTTWSLTKIRTCWFGMIVKFAPLYEKNGRNVCVEDHTKKSKEGRYVPLVNRMYQESETQSKATYVFGHMYGGCSILACRGNNISSLVAIPFLMQIHSNMSSLLTWAQMSLIGLSDAELRAAQNMIRAIQDLEVSTESSINRLVLEGCKYAQWAVRDMYLVADRAFLTYKALNAIDAHNKCSKHRVDLVTRCKTGYTAYTVKCDENGKLVADKAIKLGNILSFNTKNVRKLINPEDKSIIWHREDISMYGVTEHVKYLCLNLYWGKPLHELKFVFVEYRSKKTILVSTDLSLSATDIIELYCAREKIECTFRELNQVVNAFSSRFWTTAMPKLNRFKKSKTPDPLESVTSVDKREKIALTIRAIEMYALVSCIAIGIIQILSLRFSWDGSDFQWQRTQTNMERPSESLVQQYLQANNRIFIHIIDNSENIIGQLIRNKIDISQEDGTVKITVIEFEDIDENASEAEGDECTASVASA